MDTIIKKDILILEKRIKFLLYAFLAAWPAWAPPLVSAESRSGDPRQIFGNTKRKLHPRLRPSADLTP